MKSAAGKFVCALLLWPISLTSLPAAAGTQTSEGQELRARVTATLETNGGQYFLTLNNNSAYAFRGAARLSLGSAERQAEAGQLALVLGPNEARVLRLDALKAVGEHYTLRLYDQRGVLIFYRAATISALTSAVPGNAETVALTNEPLPAPAVPVIANPVPAASQIAPTPEVQIKLRLIAGAKEDDPFIIAFDLSATKSIMNAALNLTTGKAKQSKAVSINLHAVVEFKLPEYLESNQIDYSLTRKDGSVIAQGTANLDKLFADDHVTVGDLRTDRVNYAPGETARVTIVLEGQSPRGYKLEVVARDQAGSALFNTTVYGEPGEAAKQQEFAFTLPLEVKGPVIFEFKVYDAENNTVFDSGERELAVKSGQ